MNETVTPDSNPDQSLQLHRISEADMDHLDRLGPGPEAAAYAAAIGGITLGEGHAAVVVSKDGDNAETPIRLAALDHDLGTRLNPHNNDSRFPTLESAYDQVREPAEVSDDQAPEGVDVDHQISAIIEESGLGEAVDRWKSVIDAVDNGIRVEKRVFNEATEQLARLLNRAQTEAQNGSWAGNRFANHPQLVRQAEDLIGLLQTTNRRVAESEEAIRSPVRVFTERFSNVNEAASRDLRAIDDPKPQQLQRATRNVSDILRATVARLGNHGDDKLAKLQHAQQMLESITYDRQASVDDVMSQLQRLRGQLADLSTSPRRTLQIIREVDEPVSRLQGMLRH